MAKKIVYHGTWSDEPPHVYGETFHAGTMAATEDRAADQMMGGEVEEPAIRRVHAYEISDSAPMSRRVWSDPDIGSLRAGHDYEKTTPKVPEHKENRIYPYTNIREDRGSTSYVIPSSFVGKHVKHLGIQFQGFYGSDEQEKAMLNATTGMLGGSPRSSK